MDDIQCKTSPWSRCVYFANVAAFNADYAILPMLKKYFEKLDPDNEFTIKVDKHGVYEGFVLIPGAFKRGLPYLLPLAFTDATHLKPMGNRDT